MIEPGSEMISAIYLPKMGVWGIDSYKIDSKYSNDKKFKYRTDHLINLQNRYVEGLEALETNENAWKAFSLLNRTFDKASDYPGWRAFQIFFVVCLIPDVVDKTKRRDICEVLHVDTGGGKSEAYFGCVLFSAFWDRITGKEFGTTAITKFPLRMLSIQQLERIANIFIWWVQMCPPVMKGIIHSNAF